MTDTFARADEANRVANLIRYGQIHSVDAPAKQARVEFEDGWISDSLTYFGRRSGRVRTCSPPTVGEQCMVLSPSGEMASGAILLGLGSDAFPSTDLDTVERVEIDDDYSDQYDSETKTRTIDLPADGRLKVLIGGVPALDVSADQIVLKATNILLDGDVRLGGAGGKAIARHDDAVVAGKVVATSTKVKGV